ncbi:MAG: hypothetical protein HHAS10_00450 [Candidatus Altimarinota bacterium]
MEHTSQDTLSIEDLASNKISPSQVGNTWMRLGYRVRGRVAAFLAHEHKKRTLSYETREKMHKELLLDLENLAKGRREFETALPNILSGIERRNQRKRNIKSGRALAYNRDTSKALLSTKRSESDIEFVLKFLEQFINLRREMVIRIIFAPKIPSLLSRP